jgi:Asp-tRNA(Asn)/Glu-tRNA(Gln) amidotransferase B subunit
MEIVSEPDIRSPREAVDYMKKLRATFSSISAFVMEYGTGFCVVMRIYL